MQTESLIIDSNLKALDYKPYFNTLDKLGFCICPAFEADDIARLLTLYNDNFGNEKVKQLYATHNSNPFEKSLRVNEEIKNIVHNKLQFIFPDYDYFIGHFMVKAANEKKEFPLHQDWNIVDESKYKSYQVWIPLQLTYPANGGMFVVPGSHQFFNNYRSGSYDIPRLPYDEKFKPIITNLNVPAGDVLVYHNALFHASYPNTTNDNRIVVIVNYAEKNAPTYYFQKDENKKVTELYNIDAEILVKNLPVLEKGFINDGFPYSHDIPLCNVDNANMSADDLITAYHKNIGIVDGAQIKQLHIAIDSSLEEELNDRGYAIIDLLNKSEVEIFKAGYKDLFKNIPAGKKSLIDIQYENPGLKKAVNQFINQEIEGPLKKHFKDFNIPFSIYYTKWAGAEGDIELHADDTVLLNNQLEPHYGIWIPLCDVGANNGALTVIPGSHKVQGAFFAGSITAYHYAHKEALGRYEIPLHLRAGQAVIFDHNLLHSSTANKSSNDRVAVTFSITHTNSQYYSFNGEENGKKAMNIYKENHDFQLTDRVNSAALNGARTPDGTLKNSFLEVKIDELEQMLKAF